MTENSKKAYKKILQMVQQRNVSLDMILQFRKQYPNIAWTEIIYSETGDSILHVASRLGEETIVLYILEKWSPLYINIKNKDCKTPLHEAAQFSQPEITQILLGYGAEVDAIKRADWTPIMLACTKSGEKSLQTITNLVKAGASTKLKNKDGWTPLHLACRTGDINIVKYLFIQDKSTDICTYNGRTLLHIACLHGHIDIVKLLLDNKAQINARDKCGNTPFLEAVCSGSVNLVRLLINHNADINEINNAGMYCVHIAAGAGLSDMLRFLITDLKLNPNIMTSESVTPVHCAARNKRIDAMNVLLDLGANLSIKDNHNRTANEYLNY